MSGINDFIAAEGCYHLACLASFQRRSARPASAVESQEALEDEVMMKLYRILCVGLAHGHVYDMSDIFERYKSMCREKVTCVPQRCVLNP